MWSETWTVDGGRWMMNGGDEEKGGAELHLLGHGPSNMPAAAADLERLGRCRQPPTKCFKHCRGPVLVSYTHKVAFCGLVHGLIRRDLRKNSAVSKEQDSGSRNTGWLKPSASIGLMPDTIQEVVLCTGLASSRFGHFSVFSLARHHVLHFFPA